jgi:predicted small secreted protein
MKKITLLSLAAFILVTTLLGCNAYEGAKQDVKDTRTNVGEAIKP